MNLDQIWISRGGPVQVDGISGTIAIATPCTCFNEYLMLLNVDGSITLIDRDKSSDAMLLRDLNAVGFVMWKDQ
jgi:hypothetical protein